MKSRVIWEKLQSEFELPKPSPKQMGDLLLTKTQILFKELSEQELRSPEDYRTASHLCAEISALAGIIFDKIIDRYPDSISPEGELNR